MLRFLGFELNEQRAELRGPDGAAIKIRSRTLEMLKIFASNAGKVVSKRELMEAVWPGVQVGEDSLFQSIREIRSILGDDDRQVIKMISGRGYLFVADVSYQPELAVLEEAPVPVQPVTESKPAPHRPGFTISRRAALLAITGLGVSALAAATYFPRRLHASPSTIAVMPIVATGDDPATLQMAAGVTRDLTDGLMKIETIRVVVPPGAVDEVDYVVSSEFEATEGAWNLRTRLVERTTGAGKWTMSFSVARAGDDVPLQQTRLTAGMGHALALRINALLYGGDNIAGRLSIATPRIAIEQATAFINHTTQERFRAAQSILEKALAEAPDDVDLQISLAAFQLRGIQMDWFPAEERDAMENRVGAIMGRALRLRPDYIPVMETHCRYLVTTNQFIENLVACGKVLSVDPWNGIVLYLMGLSQIFLGRFDDALASFKQADRFDTPSVARWTWAAGAGWTYLLMGRAEEAAIWLQRSIAITPASGRPYMLLAAAYQQLGRTDEAREAMAKGMELRPHSTAQNAPPPAKNNSAVFLKASAQVVSLMVAAGLPEG